MSSRHSRTLERRRLINEERHKNINKIKESKIINDKPVKIKITMEDSKELTKDMNVNLEDLNNVFICVYTMAEWGELFEDGELLGIPFKYNWKEGDDWAPSRAYIESVETSGFITLEGYDEIQKFVEGVDPDHQKLYGIDSDYVRIAHNKNNAFIPLATDPFFLEKSYLVKERLGHMIAGSSIGWANRHILFYVAIFKQAMNQLLENDTTKIRHLIMLIINTFNQLNMKNSCTYDKSQKALSRAEILYEIAKGNTAPYLFGSSWESVMYGFSRNSSYKKAMEMYNKEMDIEINKDEKTLINNFRIQVWNMIFRHMVINMYKGKTGWDDPKLWDMASENVIKEAIK